MIQRACADLGIAPPAGADDLTSLIIAISDGLMLQWLADPDGTPDAGRTLNALTFLSDLLADEPG